MPQARRGTRVRRWAALALTAIGAAVAAAIVVWARPGSNGVSAEELTAQRVREVRFSLWDHWALEGVAGCPSLDELRRAHHLHERDAVDAWGRPLQLTCEGRDVRIRSVGLDGAPDTSDDVELWVEPYPSQ